MDVKLNVGQLEPTTTARDVEELFSQVGTVVSVQMLGEAGPNPRRAMVTMSSRAEAQKAVDQFHQAEVEGSILTVTFALVRGVTAGQQGQLSAFSQTRRSGPSKGGKPGQAGGYNSSLGAFGSGKRAPTPPRRRGGSQHR